MHPSGQQVARYGEEIARDHRRQDVAGEGCRAFPGAAPQSERALQTTDQAFDTGAEVCKPLILDNSRSGRRPAIKTMAHLPATQ